MNNLLSDYAEADVPMMLECFACRPLRQIVRLGKWKSSSPSDVFMQSQGNDLTLLVYTLSLSLFFILFHCWFAGVIVPCDRFPRDSHHKSGLFTELLFRTRLYTQTSLWRMSLLENFYISIWQHITTAPLTILWFVAPLEWIASLTQWHFFPPRLDTKWADLNFVPKQDMWWRRWAIPWIEKWFIAVRYVRKPVRVFLEVLTVTKKMSTVTGCC